MKSVIFLILLLFVSFSVRAQTNQSSSVSSESNVETETNIVSGVITEQSTESLTTTVGLSTDFETIAGTTSSESVTTTENEELTLQTSEFSSTTHLATAFSSSTFEETTTTTTSTDIATSSSGGVVFTNSLTITGGHQNTNFHSESQSTSTQSYSTTTAFSTAFTSTTAETSAYTTTTTETEITEFDTTSEIASAHHSTFDFTTTTEDSTANTAAATVTTGSTITTDETTSTTTTTTTAPGPFPSPSPGPAPGPSPSPSPSPAPGPFPSPSPAPGPFPSPSPAPKPPQHKPQPTPGGRGDPHIHGFLGQKFDFHGESGKVFNILSDSQVQINAKIVDADLAPNYKLKTYFGSFAMKFGKDRIFIACDRALDEDSHLGHRIELNGQSVVESVKRRFEGDLFTMRINEGRYRINIDHSVYSFTVQFSSSARSSCHLNIKASFRPTQFLKLIDELPSDIEHQCPHGVLGQTARQTPNMTSKGRNGEGVIEGNYLSYNVFKNDLWSDAFNYNCFNPKYNDVDEEAIDCDDNLSNGKDVLQGCGY